jgi:hypothetical protein
MDCVKCRELRQAFEFKLGQYVEARGASYYRVSTELAAHKNVDMERSRNDLEEHQLVCVSVIKGETGFAPPTNFHHSEARKAAGSAI